MKFSGKHLFKALCHMQYQRRKFIKNTGLATMGVACAGILESFTGEQEPGNNTSKVERAVAMLEDGSSLATPYWVIDSGKEGPSLAMIAAQHGNEVQGAEVARRFQKICLEQLVSGRVYLIPMSNLPAIRKRKHSSDLGAEENNRLNPDKLHNMQSHWPGNPQGNDTARIAWSLDQAVFGQCTHVVDVHCWEHVKAAETLVYYDHEPSRIMGEVTTTRFISSSAIPEVRGNTMMIRRLMVGRGNGAITVELSGQYQMRELQVHTGVSSMVNIAKRLSMIQGEPELAGKHIARRSDNSHEVIASCPGIFMPGFNEEKGKTLAPEDFVVKGQTLGHIINAVDLTKVTILAPVAGYLWQFGVCHWALCDASLPAQHPYVERGDRIALVITF
jgi:uncharacterized protein